jgi:hypothetical protein
MLITDYASLASEVVDEVDNDTISTKISRFVQGAEGHLKRRLRVLDMEVSTTETVSTETFTLPEDALSIRSIHIEGDADQNVPDLPLMAISPAAMADQFTGIAGIPSAYSRSGELVTLSSPPLEEITLAITYVAKFTPLAEDTSNWIIENYPDIYFHGTLAEAYAYLKDEAREAKSLARFHGAVDDLVQARAKDKWGPGMAFPSPVRQVSGARC